jgi:hypothetical protein
MKRTQTPRPHNILTEPLSAETLVLDTIETQAL